MTTQFSGVFWGSYRCWTSYDCQASEIYGEVIYRSTYRGLTDAEVVNQAHIKSQEEFDEAIGNQVGADCTPVGGYPITTSSTM